jgi:outer membrane protein TolC
MKQLEGMVRKIIHRKKSAGFLPLGSVFLRLFLASVLARSLAFGQIPGIAPGGSSSSGSSSSSSGSSSGTSSPSYGSDSGVSGAAATLSQSPYGGSVPEGKANSEVLPISFKEAIDRALRNNLGALLGSDNTLTARGQRWHELSALLPHVSASLNQSAAQIDLAAEGFRFNFAGIPKVIGPIGIWQSQVSLSQSLFDFNAIERTRGASANLQASQFAYKDARDIVVLAAGNAYLEALSGAARVDTEQAQVVTAQAVYDRSVDQQKAGVSPAIDALRARVELQSQQQQLIVAKNNYAKEKLSLARVIGLPPGQQYALTDKAPFEPLAEIGVEQALQQAYTSRSDYMAAAQQVRAAEYLRRAATAEHYPVLSIAGDYGDAGIRPGSSHGVFQAGVTLDIPVFAGGKVHGDVLQAEAALRQSRQQLENLRGQIDQDVRTALLDLSSAAEQVEVARSTVDLANQTLTQSRDRFAAGVTDNLEVVQAQESLASANESYISSLYAHNLAKVELARAIGFAEQGVRLYLQGK